MACLERFRYEALILCFLKQAPISFSGAGQRCRKRRIMLQRGMEQRNSRLQAADVLIVLQVTYAAHVILIRIGARIGIRDLGVLVFWPKLASHHVQEIVRNLVFEGQEIIDVCFDQLGTHVAG